MSISVHSLWIYPVKSLAGFEVDTAILTPKGLLGDRIWMVVKPCGTMLTQRQAPQMACITAQFTQPNTPLTSPIMLIDTRDNSRITVPRPNGENTLSTTVHKDTCPANVASDIANTWLTQKIQANMPLRLVAFKPQAKRTMSNHIRFGEDATHFADAAPYLVVNKHAVDTVNNALRSLCDSTTPSTVASHPCAQVSLANFRPNIVIQGLRAFDEHQYTALAPTSHQNWHMPLIDHCQRCSMITNNPQLGKIQPSPLFKVITQLNPMPNNPKAPAFGVNATLTLTGTPSPVIVSKNEALKLII